ncbi:WD repeat-containing protein 88-like [Pungitius pungitius]|uniref:WD repeat-containing protein 88-like n=1 Tax=Pungitius pungitius TaxID=134920 RepID=UPI001889674D|nr:WD repeat-containing protein 88-like [Pungitius pungitius]
MVNPGLTLVCCDVIACFTHGLEKGYWFMKAPLVPVKLLRAHSDDVNGARLCFNDRFLLSCSSDRRAILWDVESCRPLKVFDELHSKTITECSQIPNTNRPRDRTDSDPQNCVSISEASSGQTLHLLTDHHRSTITRCRFDPRSQRVVTVAADRGIKLWDLLAQKTTVSINSNHSNVVSNCCFTSSGYFLCTASWDKSLKLWDLQAGGFRSHGGTTLQRGHEGIVSSCCFSADATLLVSGSYDRTVALWDTCSSSRTLVLKGHSDWVTDVSITADRKLVASASKDRSVRLWNIDNMEEIPEVMKSRRTDGLQVLQTCEECTKSFPASRLQTSETPTRCVFCRLSSSSTYRPQPPPPM